MNVSEDGTVTGSIDRAQLEQIEPKTDEARAQVDALLAQHQAGEEQAAADAQRLLDAAAAQNPAARPTPDTRDAQGVETQGRPQYGAVEAQDEAQDEAAQADEGSTVTAEPAPADGDAAGEDVDALRAEAEGLGVKVDRRWGADRLRSEVAAAREG